MKLLVIAVVDQQGAFPVTQISPIIELNKTVHFSQLSQNHAPVWKIPTRVSFAIASLKD